MSSVERSDDTFTAWMHLNLARAAERFGLTLTADPRFGWRLRSISAPARDGAGRPRWLRVLSERYRWLDEAWTGNVDANLITGVPKPRVLDWCEWDVPEQGRRVRAEVMTLIRGRRCSPTDVLRQPLSLPDAWWNELAHSLVTIRTTPTERFADQPATSRRAREVFGLEIRVQQWETVHGDLHWANLIGPDFALLDWEMWGRGPAGTDAAHLYCMSLLVPEVASRVRDQLWQILDTPAGQVAQILVAARLLHRASLGDFPELTDPVNELARKLLHRAA